MRYDDPNLRDRLAAEYVLGTMPWRSRRRLERAMENDPALARSIGDWAERFSAIDRTAPAEEPPARVWRAIEARIMTGSAADRPVPAIMQSLRAALRFWRALAIAASAGAAAAIIWLATFLVPVAPQVPRVVAVLADQGGEPAWIATSGPRRGEIAIAALRPQQSGAGHSFELWGIDGGAPRPLGLLQSLPDQPTVLSAEALPALGGVLAVTLEPSGGSPSGLPTGPVLFHGKVIRSS